MKFIKEHSIFSLLVVGIISLAFSVNNSSIFNQYLVETELEESVFESDELSPVLKITNSDNGGNGGVATIVSSTYFIPYFYYTSSIFLNSKKLFQKQPFFILYCCLKIDC